MGLSSSILIGFHENVILLYLIQKKKGKTVSKDDLAFCNELLQKEAHLEENAKNKEMSCFKITFHTQARQECVF